MVHLTDDNNLVRLILSNLRTKLGPWLSLVLINDLNFSDTLNSQSCHGNM